MKKTKRSSHVDKLDPSVTNSPKPVIEKENDDYFDAEEVKSLEDENTRLKEEIELLRKKTANSVLLEENKELFSKLQRALSENEMIKKQNDLLRSSPDSNYSKQVVNLEERLQESLRDNEIKSERIVDLLTENKKLSRLRPMVEDYELKIAKLERQVKEAMTDKSATIVKPFATVIGYVDGEPVMYRLKIECTTGSYEIKKRYKEFLALYREISKIRTNLPRFPEKMIIGNHQDQYLRRRCEGLALFVDYVCNDSELLASKNVVGFFAK